MGSANQSTEQRRHPWQPKHTLQLGVRGERAHRAVSMPSRHGRNVCKRRDTAAAEICGAEAGSRCVEPEEQAGGRCRATWVRLPTGTPGESQVIDYINEVGQDASVSAAFCQSGIITPKRAVCIHEGARTSWYLCLHQCMWSANHTTAFS